MVLHTFGRDLKWNPHIHCLISEGDFSDDSFWRNISYFNYTFLRNAFRTALLDKMESILGPSFKKVKASYKVKNRHLIISQMPYQNIFILYSIVSHICLNLLCLFSIFL